MLTMVHFMLMFSSEFFLKRKEILSHAAVWMDLEDIRLNEISQLQKDRYCVSPLIKWDT